MSRFGRWLRKAFGFWRRESPKTATPTERLGAWGEEIAAKHLASQGYRIVERRLREGRGELDIIAVGTDKLGAFVVFVEVKTRSSEAFGGPEAGMDRRKRDALRRSAMHYLHRLPGGMPRFRFDLVAVVGSPDSREPPTVRHETDVLRFDSRVQVEWARPSGRKRGRNHR